MPVLHDTDITSRATFDYAQPRRDDRPETYPEGRTCGDCGNPLSIYNGSRICNPCGHSRRESWLEEFRGGRVDYDWLMREVYP
jgi:hypothetical protein